MLLYKISGFEMLLTSEDTLVTQIIKILKNANKNYLIWW